MVVALVRGRAIRPRLRWSMTRSVAACKTSNSPYIHWVRPVSKQPPARAPARRKFSSKVPYCSKSVKTSSNWRQSYRTRQPPSERKQITSRTIACFSSMKLSLTTWACLGTRHWQHCTPWWASLIIHSRPWFKHEVCLLFSSTRIPTYSTCSYRDRALPSIRPPT